MRHTSSIVAVPLRPTRDYHPSASSAAPKLSGHVPYALDGKTAAETSSNRASFPGKRERKCHWKGLYSATGWDAFLLKPLLRVPYVYSAYRTQPKYNILTSTRKVLSPRPEKGFEFSRLFDHFGPRFRASDHVVLHHVSAEGTSASCCIRNK